MNQITHNVNDIAIGQRPADGYINLTAMAQANGKLIADYLRLETTKAFAEELSKTMGIPIVNLIQVKAGRNGGTWGHPQVAIHCGQWCSAQFAVLVSKWVYDWMREGKEPTALQSVPSQRERLETIHLGIRLFQELGGCDPRTELMLKDHIRNILLEEKLHPALPGRVEWPV